MTDAVATSDRHAFLVMPGYGNLTVGAAVGMYEASTGAVTVNGQSVPLHVTRRYHCASLLAHNFNTLWCAALNRLVDGERVDYFAMLHDDIEPQRGWLDVAIEELESHDLDVLGVVVPLKLHLGLTSIALARPDGNPWRPRCRLTMHEVHRLPETFTSDYVGHPLLLNTGCWVCRFDPSWVERFPGFTINDRTVQRDGRWSAEVEPEDWNFSRWCHASGLRLGATRKVAVAHAGSQRFGNANPWGEQKYDSEFLSESLIGNAVQPSAAIGEPAAIPLEV